PPAPGTGAYGNHKFPSEPRANGSIAKSVLPPNSATLPQIGKCAACPVSVMRPIPVLSANHRLPSPPTVRLAILVVPLAAVLGVVRGNGVITPAVVIRASP